MEGETIEKIMDVIMDESMMETFKGEFDSKSKPVEEELDCFNAKNMQNEGESNMEEAKEEAPKELELEVKLSYLLVEDTQYISKLINIAQEGNYVRGWETIKKLPYCKKMLKEVEDYANKSLWYHIFDEAEPEMSWIYNSHLLKKVIRDEEKMKEYLIEKKGYQYLVTILKTTLSESQNNILLDLLTSIILFPLKNGCKSIELFGKRIEGEWPPNLLNILIEECYMEEAPSVKEDLLSGEFIDKIIEALLDGNKNYVYSQFPATNMYYLVLYSMQFHQETTLKILSLTKADTHQLLKLHGYSGEYLIVMALAKAVVLNLNPPKTMEQILK